MRTATVTFTETTAGANPPLTAVLTIRQGSIVPEGPIPVNTLEQLNAIRYDLDTDGRMVSNASAYFEAFPDLSSRNKYKGYQLMRDLMAGDIR